MLDLILPEGTAVAATRNDLDAQLFPEEELIIRRAVESRRREFTTARICARNALAQLGLPLQAIPAGPCGNPQWPAGTVGSITHCDGYRAAALAHACDFVAIGIDAEPNRRLPDGVLAAIASPKELQWLRQRMCETLDVCWDRLLFSIKEAVYKVWFPLTARTLGFKDVSVVANPACREFSARVHVAGLRLGDSERPSLSGRWLVRDGLIVAAIALSAS